jgi:L-fuculose-phosphate aldolase
MNVVKALSGRSAAILRNHGALTYGETLAEAYERAITLEWVSQVYYRARLLGEPSIVPSDEIEHVFEEMVGRGYAVSYMS